jgi:DNA-binding response OmpR family regulator
MATTLRPALIVLDMGLPLLSGEELAESLKSLSDPPPLLVVSAAGTIAERAQRIGATGHLAKPFELDDLIAAVNQALQGHDGAERMEHAEAQLQSKA